jgi:anaerobic magnesium-protoporphyrin IX monomethyl ester cyclase
MKVYLLNPPTYSQQGFIREGRCQQRLASFQYVMTPITLPSIAGLLREKGYEVFLRDAMALQENVSTVLQAVEQSQARLLIAVSSTVTLENDLAVLAEMKQKIPDLFIALSGTHASSLPEDILQHATSLDAIIRNEPEMTALELAQTLDQESKGNLGNELARVQGLSYRHLGQIFHNPQRPYLEDLDSLPFPARDLLPLDRYRLPTLNEPYTLLIPSRGCPYHCTFCTAHQYYGKKMRLRNPHRVVDEIEEIVQVHQIHQIHMWSDTFTLSRKFVMEFCDEMILRALPVQWMCNGRVDSVDLELLQQMKAGGCTGIAYGVESGVQEILDRCKKDITLEQIQEAFRWTRQAGIDTLAHVIFGLPGETPKTIKSTIRFILALDPTYAQFYCAIPFPGTELREEALRQGWVSDFQWSDYEINHALLETPQLSRKQLLDWKNRAYLRFYWRPQYLLRQASQYWRSPKELLQKSKQFFFFMKDWAQT